MMSKYETRTVRSLVRLLAAKESVPRSMIQAQISLFAGAALFILGAMLFRDGNHLSGGGGYVLLYLSGALTGAGIYQSVANRQWPIVRKHLDRRSLKLSCGEAKREERE
jgi:hypothetical protein